MGRESEQGTGVARGTSREAKSNPTYYVSLECFPMVCMPRAKRCFRRYSSAKTTESRLSDVRVLSPQARILVVEAPSHPAHRACSALCGRNGYFWRGAVASPAGSASLCETDSRSVGSVTEVARGEFSPQPGVPSALPGDVLTHEPVARFPVVAMLDAG